MESKLFGTRLYVSLSKLAHNVNFLKSYCNISSIIAMVKANAYGHGDIFIAEKLQNLGVSSFGVADFDEGLRLRRHGIEGSIMVMNPGVYNLQIILENNLQPVIYNDEILSMLTQLIQNEKLPKILFKDTIYIHIKINTGMNRWGFDVSNLPKVISKLEKLKRVKIKSIYSHLSSAGNVKDDLFTQNQIHQFENVCEVLQDTLPYSVNYHIFNSSAFLRQFEFKKPHSIRSGILLYGCIDNKNLHAIAELRCAISDIRLVNPGDTIGYQRSYIVKKKMKIGVLPFGYADGLQRHWGNGKLNFLYNDKLLPTIGDISMDSCIIDLSELENVSIGDDVLYFGEKRSIWDLAKELNTIPYEITATLSRRIKRIYF